MKDLVFCLNVELHKLLVSLSLLLRSRLKHLGLALEASFGDGIIDLEHASQQFEPLEVIYKQWFYRFFRAIIDCIVMNVV